MDLITPINSVEENAYEELEHTAPGQRHASFLKLGAIRQIAVFGIHHSSPSLNLLISPLHAYHHVYIYPTNSMIELNLAIKPDTQFFKHETLMDKINQGLERLEQLDKERIENK